MRLLGLSGALQSGGPRPCFHEGSRFCCCLAALRIGDVVQSNDTYSCAPRDAHVGTESTQVTCGSHRMPSNLIAAKDKHGGISTRPIPLCPLCCSAGTRLYTDRSDLLFGVPGLWDFRKCTNRCCASIWLDPRPQPWEIPNLYATYYTHSETPGSSASFLKTVSGFVRDCYLAGRYGYTQISPRWCRPIGWLAYIFPIRRSSVDFDIMCLSAKPGGSLLEVGCGSGAFLARMQRLGWTVCGIDPDPGAVASGQKLGLDARCGTLQQFKFQSDLFDVIAMSHVIEHVDDPVALLEECLRVLRPGGRLVLTTPNSGSWGSALFGGDWRGLEPPRHFVVFSLKALQKCMACAGFTTLTSRSISRWGKSMFAQSQNNRKGGSGGKLASLYVRTLGSVFQLVESLAEKFSVWAGEEIYFVGQKPCGRTGDGSPQKSTQQDQAHSILSPSVPSDTGK